MIIRAARGTEVALQLRVPEQWICLFEGRAGAKARAVFATEHQAKQYAERHAQVAAAGIPLKWNEQRRWDGAHDPGR